MGKASRDKGARGEREVRDLLRAAGFPTERVPNSGGLFIPGDVTSRHLSEWAIEVKRAERLEIAMWLPQAHASAAAAERELGHAVAPLLVFRRDARHPSDPCAIWHGILPLSTLLRLL